MIQNQIPGQLLNHPLREKFKDKVRKDIHITVSITEGTTAQSRNLGWRNDVRCITDYGFMTSDKIRKSNVHMHKFQKFVGSSI